MGNQAFIRGIKFTGLVTRKFDSPEQPEIFFISSTVDEGGKTGSQVAMRISHLSLSTHFK